MSLTQRLAALRSPTALGVALVVPATLCVLLFVVAPVGAMGAFSFWTRLPDGTIDSTLTLANWRLVFADAYYWSILFDTLVFALGCTLLSAVMGYGPAVWLARQPPGRRALLMILLLLPSWISYVIRTMSWLPVLGRVGVLNQLLMSMGLIDKPLDLLYTDVAIAFGMVQFLLPLMMLNIYLGLAAVDANAVSAARSLGASRWTAFVTITFPLALPGLLAGMLLCFILSTGAYIAPLILGGPGTTYYSKLIYDEIVGQQNWPLGAALALVLVIVFVVLLSLYARFVGLKHLIKGRG